MMKNLLRKLPVWIIPMLWMVSAQAYENAPWGRASLQAIEYAPDKVVYDIAVPDIETFSRVLDRVSYLKTLYHANRFEASIVLVLYGDEIPFFAIDKDHNCREFMRRTRLSHLS